MHNKIFYSKEIVELNCLTWLVLDGGHHHIETSPLICRANQWTVFYMIWTSVMKKLMREHMFVQKMLVIYLGHFEKYFIDTVFHNMKFYQVSWNCTITSVVFYLVAWNKYFVMHTWHCVKKVQIRSFFWSVFYCIRTEFGELRSKSLYSARIQENTDEKKTPYLDTFHAA